MSNGEDLLAPYLGKGVGYDTGAPTYQAPESLGYLFKADKPNKKEKGFPRQICVLTGKL